MTSLLRNILLAAVLAAPAAAQTPATTPETADPHQWLEDIDAPRSMDWVAKENARTAGRLEADPRYETFRREALAIFTAQDRIPTPSFRAGGVDNVWQDAAHVHGIWRRTTLAGFRSATPPWETLLDLDALSKAEGRNWFFKGATCLKPAETLCLVRLSDGGGDAVQVREFDTVTKAFVTGGFRFDTAKQNVDWIDRDTLIVGRPWTPADVTRSGYAYIVKTVTRGGGAAEVFRGEPGDVSAQASVLRDDDGRAAGVVIRRSVSFFENEFSLLTPGGPVRIPLPKKAEQRAFVKGQAVFALKADWQGFRAGALIAYDLAALKAGAATAKPVLVFQPGPRQAVQQVTSTRGRLIVALLDDVKGAVDAYDLRGGRWSGRRLDLPKNANITVIDGDGGSEQLFATAEGFLDPTALWLADAATGRAQPVKALPARFAASGHVVEQFWATSTDGTPIPYFLVRPRTMKPGGLTPTILYGYGGFELAKPPIYLPEMGKLWLERGGAYVIANIRGGGEFGPAWHEAVLREKRQLAFDDFAAVARDLAARGVADAKHVGIYGRSNGGVLTSVSITQHPELWNAAVIESPLIDMLRYSHLSAGASWIGEYGDPDIPADRAFIARYSAYQQLKPGVAYPEPYITTNTRDDRVHPGHARKFAARMAEIGAPYLFYEQTFGGHANDADPELNARRWARHYVYLAQKLMD